MDGFFHNLMNIETPFNMVVLVVLIGAMAGLIGKVAAQVRIYATHRSDVQLKRELVERGLSVDEIERVVAAQSPLKDSVNTT